MDLVLFAHGYQWYRAATEQFQGIGTDQHVGQIRAALNPHDHHIDLFVFYRLQQLAKWITDTKMKIVLDTNIFISDCINRLLE